MTDKITATASASFASSTATELSKRYSFVLEAGSGSSESSNAYTAVKVDGVTTEYNGKAPVRLYTPVNAQVYVTGSYARDGLLASEGQRSCEIYEAVGFSGSKSVALSKGYGFASDVQVVRSTEFYNKSGRSAATPSQTAAGLFEAQEEVYGSLIVRYDASYWLYLVEFGVPDDALAEVMEGALWADIALPPITVLAFGSGGYTASLDVARRIGGDSVGGDSQECGQENEIERKTTRIRTYHKDDETGEIDWDVSTDQDVVSEIISQCSTSGEKRTKRFNVKLEDNQVVLQ